jgi:hypothetical protein
MLELQILDGEPRHLQLRGIAGYGGYGGHRRDGGHGADARAALEDALVRLRACTTAEALAPLGLTHGFRLDDAVAVTLYPARAEEGAALAAHLARVLPPGCRLSVSLATGVATAPATGVATAPATAAAPSVADGAPALTLDALLRERDNLRRRPPYERLGARLHVEAFELHVVEHCNLRCAHCCNMSPYLDQRFLSVDDVAQQCTMMAQHLAVDVFKIMGGEPLLHPQITDVLHAIRKSGISDVIRLFTNGLLLARMDDAFWQALDQLTISSYASAPVKPQLLDEYRDKARRFDVVLNVKPVDQFSQVMAGARRDDAAAVQRTYDACWLRDRCLIVRNGRFFKCTRAAYFAEYQARIAVAGPHPDPAAVVAADGIPVDAPDLDTRLYEYMNAKAPLESCRYCLGSSGPLVPHTQLTRHMIRQGQL